MDMDELGGPLFSPEKERLYRRWYEGGYDVADPEYVVCQPPGGRSWYVRSTRLFFSKSSLDLISQQWPITNHKFVTKLAVHYKIIIIN